MASSTTINPSSSNNNSEDKTQSDQHRKLFIGGLHPTTTNENLKEYCSKYGELTECIIIRDREGRSRGFGFISFTDYSIVDEFLKHRPHTINGKKVEVKRALPRDEASKPEGQLTVEKIFIGGIKDELTEDDLRSYFQKFGNIIECNILKDKQDKLRGFAFLTFDDYDSVDRCILEKPHKINDKELDVRKAIPREQTSRINSEFSYPSNFLYNPYFPTMNYSSKPISLVNPSSYEFSKKISSSTLSHDEQHRKLFLGGLSLKTTDETLKEYMTKYGETTDCLVMKDHNGQSKCFGFVTFTNSSVVDEFMKQRPHILDGRQIDPKRAMPREEATNDDVHLTVKKIFIGRIRDGLDENSLRKYFEKYGTINDCRLMHDQNGKTRGFAFIEFDDYDSVDKIILSRPHMIDEHSIDVKKAVPKDQRLFQAQQQQQQQHYALQMQAAAAAAAAYYYNYFPYYFSNNSPLIPSNGAFKTDNQTLNINNNISNSPRYLPTPNSQ